jgi:hypothetical protein
MRKVCEEVGTDHWVLSFAIALFCGGLFSLVYTLYLSTILFCAVCTGIVHIFICDLNVPKKANIIAKF